MKFFSEKILDFLGDQYYVYGLIDPRDNKIFYIGKGKGNRIFDHENEAKFNQDTHKLQIINEIKTSGSEVEKLIINLHLTEDEAFAAETALINVFDYIGNIPLTNLVAGHHSLGALKVEELEAEYGAEELAVNDIKHKIMFIKINKLYERGMDSRDLYDAVRGVWRAAIDKAKKVEYVFGVYNLQIVAVYKPSRWYVCKDAANRLPRKDLELSSEIENRIFFEDDDYKNDRADANVEFYCGKSISNLMNKTAQNPITYIGL